MSRRGLVRAAAVCAAALVVGACGSGGSDDVTSTSRPQSSSGGVRDTFVPRPGVPGVTDDEIRFAVVGTRSGNPLGTCILDCYLDGINAYFAYRNSEGGIFGRRLTVGVVHDDEIVQNQVKSLEVVASKNVFGAFQATLLASGWAALDSAGVPTYAWGIHATESAGRPAIYPSSANRCADCPRPSTSHIASQLGKSKVGAIGYGVTENSKVCTNTAAKAVEAYAADSGVELAYKNDNLAFGLPNGIGPEVTAMKNAGVDFISSCIDLNGMKTLAQELDRQGMQDVVLLHPNTYDQNFVAAADGLFEGDVVSVAFRPFESTSKRAGLEKFLEWMAAEGSQPTELAMVGWINATTAFEGLLAAGPEFDRAGVIAATNALSAFTADGLLAPVDWTVAHVPFLSGSAEAAAERYCAAFVKVVDGAFEPLVDGDAPWLCWGPGAKPRLEPESVDFE